MRNWSYHVITKFLACVAYEPHPVSIDHTLLVVCFLSTFLCRGVLCLSIVTSTFLLSIEFNSDSFGIRTMIIKENYNVPTLVGKIQKIHRQEPVLRPPVDFLYISHIS